MQCCVSKLLYSALVVCFVLSPAAKASDWQSNVKRTWDYKTDGGTLKIVLLVSPQFPASPSLDLVYDGVQSLSLAQETDFLRNAVSQLPAAGVDPRKLSRISLRGPKEREVAQRLAIAALHSKEWASRTTATGGAERVTEDLLNAIGAYDAFNDIFAPYGLTVKGLAWRRLLLQSAWT